MADSRGKIGTTSKLKGLPDLELFATGMAPPLLVILSGPSGVGKDAVIGGLRQLDRPWHFAVTATTRNKRESEQDGEDYIFLDHETFTTMRERDEFLECAQVYGRWYGVPRSQVRYGLKSGRDVILKIDVQGADTVRNLFPEAVSIFLIPDSISELEGRLENRRTESSAEMQVRLQTAQNELAQMDKIEYRVINKDNLLHQAIIDVDAIITAEKCRMKPRLVELL